MWNQIKARKYATGDFSDWSWNDATRCIAIHDFKTGKTDADQYAARIELLRRNPNLESRPTNEMAEVMKQFYRISNEITESDEESDEESGEKSQADRICIQTVIARERARVSIDRMVDL